MRQPSTTRFYHHAAWGLLGLMAPAALHAAIFTVGPGGSHGTIQGALDAARATFGSHEVRVAKGSYAERLAVFGSDGTLRISGGWDGAFGVQDPASPWETLVDAAGVGRPLYVECARGRIEISDLVFRGGHLVADASGNAGGGVMVIAQGTCDVRLSRNLVSENLIEKNVPGPAADPVPWGGGIYGFVGGTARLAVTRSIVYDNRLRNHSTGGAAGAGAYFVVHDSGTLDLADTELIFNTAESVGSGPHGGGLSVEATEGSRVRMVDLLVTDNRLSGPTPVGSGVALSAAPSPCSDCEISLARAEIWSNLGGSDADQLRVISGENGRVAVTDSLVARGDGLGLNLWSLGGTAALTNLTVVDHPGTGLAVSGSNRVFNTIVTGNGVDVQGLTPSPSNLVGIDPLFVDRAAGDFRLSRRSPAVDAGDDAPPDGLGTRDLDGRARILGAHVDIGAFERWPPPGYRLCDVDRHGTLPFVAEFAPVCSCLQHDDLRSLQCGFTFPGWFVDLEIPWPVFPGEKIAAEWTLHPWGSIDGPYQVAASLVVGGKEMPLDPGTGPIEGEIWRGKDIATTFQLQVPHEPASLRVRLLFEPAGAKGPNEGVTDILLGSSDQKSP